MPKNPHPPRGPAKGKKSASSANDQEDTSFIVFSNAKGEPKKPKQANPGAEAGSSVKVKGKSKQKESQDSTQTEDGPKKPDTRTLIAGSSWTGKLPVNLLSEHCQKQKWHKPEYTMVGFRLRLSD
jgi:ATP-dependent RNA helicase DHX57